MIVLLSNREYNDQIKKGPPMPTRTVAATAITSVTLDAVDPATADEFYRRAFALGDAVRTRGAAAPTAGFRGFTMSLIVSQPATVDALVDAALAAGATAVKPAKKG